MRAKFKHLTIPVVRYNFLEGTFLVKISIWGVSFAVTTAAAQSSAPSASRPEFDSSQVFVSFTQDGRA